MSVKIQGVNLGYTLELYTASYTRNSLYNARNGAIQPTRPVPRACQAIQLYTAIQHARIQLHYTAYSLYTIQPYRPTLCATYRLADDLL